MNALPPPNTHLFRQTMGRFATGVTIMTVYTQDDDHEWLGMTANAVTSVSLAPLQMLVCVGKHASITNAVLNTDGFALSILTEDQHDLSNYFARIWDEDSPPPTFSVEDWSGGPRLDPCLGAIACQIKEIVEGGDHWIIIGEVMALHQSKNDYKPLIFYRGDYWHIGGKKA